MNKTYKYNLLTMLFLREKKLMRNILYFFEPDKMMHLLRMNN